MPRASLEQVAGWLAEALESGNALAPLPEGTAPADAAEGEHVAALALASLGLVPCGVRVVRGPAGGMLSGPVLEGRLLPDGAAIALATARHAMAAPGVMGVLAEDLAADRGDAPPVFSALHPILDVSAWRLREPPRSTGLAAADLAGHGFIVAGRGKRGIALPDALPVGIAPSGVRRRPERHDIAAALLAVAEAARRAGGLPRGAVLAAVLGPGVAPLEGQEIVGGFGALGRVRAAFR